MTDTVDLAEFLEKLLPFSNLTDDELDGLAAISEELEYEDGAIVAFQGDVADAMYIVRSGRLYAERRLPNAGGTPSPVEKSKDYLPGDYFGEEWLFVPGAHPATVEATTLRGEKARVIVIRSDRFLNFINQYPDCITGLEPEYDPVTGDVISGFEPEAWQEAQKADVKKKTKKTVVPILPDELVEYSARRSKYYLLVKLIWPVIGWIITVGIVYLIFAGQSEGSFFYGWEGTAVIIISLIFLGILLFRILDWSNDYFLVTNKRIVHREFDLRTFRIDIKTARIDQIQSVEIVTPSFLANHLHYGDAVITTASSFGTIVFDNIGSPDAVKEALDRLTSIVKKIDSSRQQTLMRESLDNYFEINQKSRVVKGAEADGTLSDQTSPNLTGSLGHGLRKRFAWRIDEEGTITYRKHYIVLLFMTATQLAGFALLFLIAYLIISFFSLSTSQVAPFFIILFLIDLAWFIWEVEDWRNDIFQVTDRMVIDIDRRPFGFGQSQKQAPLERIQNVNAYTPGLLHTLFNYGNVDIETAGDAINIEFDDVPYPSVIMSDIFARLDELEEKAFKRRSAARHKEYAVMLDVYQQAREQDLISSRTPESIPPLEDDSEE